MSELLSHREFDQESAEALERKRELNTYVLVSIGVQREASVDDIFQSLPNGRRSEEMKSMLEEFVFDNPWQETGSSQVMGCYLEREFISTAQAEFTDEGRVRLTTAGQQAFERIMDGYDHTDEQISFIQNILDNLSHNH